jgi:hypothetical protein
MGSYWRADDAMDRHRMFCGWEQNGRCGSKLQLLLQRDTRSHLYIIRFRGVLGFDFGTNQPLEFGCVFG